MVVELCDGTVAREEADKERGWCWASMALGPKRERRREKSWARRSPKLFRIFRIAFPI